MTGLQVSRDDGKGNLWLMSERGIFRISIRELNDFAEGKIPSIFPVSYGRQEGMKSTTLAGFGVCLTRDGELWFPNSRGIVAIDPAAVNPIPPTVVVEEASANHPSIGRVGRASMPPGHDTGDSGEKTRARLRHEADAPTCVSTEPENWHTVTAPATRLSVEFRPSRTIATSHSAQ